MSIHYVPQGCVSSMSLCCLYDFTHILDIYNQHLFMSVVAVAALAQDVDLVFQAVDLPAQARLDTPLSAEQSNTNRERRGLKEKGLSTGWSHILQESFMPRINKHKHQGK